MFFSYNGIVVTLWEYLSTWFRIRVRDNCGILRLKTERDINKEKGEIYFYARIRI